MTSLHRFSHPLTFNILELHDRLACRGFSVLLCWVPSHVEARKIVNDRTPKPGISYSSALNSVVTPSCSQNMQFIPSITNTTTAPTTVTPPSDNDVITIKKSDWLSLLEIKKSWEKTFSSVSEACAVPLLVTTFQPTSACSTASNS
ncbi:hypothetical protein AVEN_42934-1 [Araneus ventricosus]|uniref:RNase H type-1 domain-containing protein n=1 Tax=Araneus ventricosus TaxID=182803 RepID=A0A4Y2AGV2_ARAVE|nr:hypothetical protein AVEN_42934-1 [Araneus ventricosus]